VQPKRRSLLVVLVLAGILAGCRLDVTAEGRIDQDGTGVARLVLEADEALLDELDGLGVDPTAEVVAAGADAAPWTVEREAGGDTLTLRLSRRVDDPRALGDAFRELAAGLADDDPALVIDLDVTMTDDGALTVHGDAGLRPPASIGVELDGVPVGPDAELLAGVTEDAVRARLVLQLPGSVAAHDGDALDGRRVTWLLPVGGTRSLSATSAAPTPVDAVPAWGWALGGLAVVVMVALALWLVARRRAGRSSAVAGAPGGAAPDPAGHDDGQEEASGISPGA
jgi:hypothetical protein